MSIFVLKLKFMTIYKEFRVGGNSGSPMGFLGPLLILALFFTAMFFFFKGLFRVLNIIAPILLVGTLILDYTVVKDFFIFLLRLLKENPLMGVLSLVLLFFGYPFVSGFLFAKALLRRFAKNKIKAFEKQRNTYTEYEEIKEKEDNCLELPPVQKTSGKKPNNPYDDVFS